MNWMQEKESDFTKMRIFLDANILFSASLQGSHMRRLVDQSIKNHQVLSSKYAYEEALRNLHLKRNSCVPALISLAREIEIIQSVDGDLPVPIPDKDRPILYTALKSGSDILLTGDLKDFGHLMSQPIGSLTVVSPLQMPAILKDMLSSPDS